MDKQDFEFERRLMVEEQLRMRGLRDEKVLSAMLKIPREVFVPEGQRSAAYADCPLPIGESQTISQPYMVAAMTEYLDVQKEHKVLEIGTGSGYQTAILAELAGSVYTVERIGSLQDRAKRVLDELGYDNIDYLAGDGTLGWEEAAPFDRIIVTAGAPKVPQSLKDQLNEGGIIIIPVGGDFGQELTKVVKKRGKFHERFLMDCIFVKLKGKEGW